jgi:hypothetical protein
MKVKPDIFTLPGTGSIHFALTADNFGLTGNVTWFINPYT